MPTPLPFHGEPLWSKFEPLRHQVAVLERLVYGPRTAPAEVKKLSGLLPICSCCKKIHNEGGEWQQMELFIREHSEADFSHGLCPEYAEITYARFAGQIADRPRD